jgi:hypothetical protein
MGRRLEGGRFSPPCYIAETRIALSLVVRWLAEICFGLGRVEGKMKARRGKTGAREKRNSHRLGKSKGQFFSAAVRWEYRIKSFCWTLG